MSLLSTGTWASFAFLALAGVASAQNPIVGGPGNSVIMGTNGADDITDPTGGDHDIMDDDTGFGGDGVPDHLNSTDGDNNDMMHGGPEDSFKGDPGDFVRIEHPNGDVWWQGPYSEYRKIRRMIDWIRDMLDPAVHVYPQGNSIAFDVWMKSLQQIGEALDKVVVVEKIDLDQVFPLSDDDSTVCYECWSPANLWWWMPYAPNSEPESFILSADEFASLRDDLNGILNQLMKVVAEAQ